MHFAIFRKNSFVHSQRSLAVARDADELIQIWGGAAYERATYLSWREDSGLVQSPRPGHWWSVRREIGRRLGQGAEPVAEFAA